MADITASLHIVDVLSLHTVVANAQPRTAGEAFQVHKILEKLSLADSEEKELNLGMTEDQRSYTFDGKVAETWRKPVTLKDKERAVVLSLLKTWPSWGNAAQSAWIVRVSDAFGFTESDFE